MRDQKPPLLIPPCFLPTLWLFHISLATMFRWERHHPPAPRLCAYTQPGAFYSAGLLGPGGYVDGRGRAWYSDTEHYR